MIRQRLSALAAVSLLALCPLAALAHAHLEQAQPAEGSSGTAPTQFLLKFSEQAHLTALTLLKSGDAQPRKIGPLPTAASAQFALPAPHLDPGAYELRYRVMSADGHPMAGSVHFAVTAEAH